MRNEFAYLIFIIVLFAYTIQTELAQYVTTTQGYKKPYFLLYLTHSGYLFILPIHLLVLKLMGQQLQPALSTLRAVLRHQFASPPLSISNSIENLNSDLPSNITTTTKRDNLKKLLIGERRRKGRKEWKIRLGKTVLKLSFLIGIPSLTWYSAVPLTSMTDITAIYNIFAFWAYLLSIKFLKEKPTSFKLTAVLVAIIGVFIIAYGDSFLISIPDSTKPDAMTEAGEGGGGGKDRFLGNVLALIGSISYAWYEVWYKLNVSLPTTLTNLEEQEHFEQEPDESDSLLSSSRSSFNNDSETTIQGIERNDSPVGTIREEPASGNNRFKNLDGGSSIASFLPPPVPITDSTFLLHSNFFTSLIGLTTLTLLWIPIPILHYLSLETFSLPPLNILLSILGMILAGVVFNAGFMILLSVWGPVIASVGNLCTLVLVALADMFIGGVFLSWYTIGGSGLVVFAFGMLVWGNLMESREGD